MKYVSTRGEAPALGFSDVLLAGLASDGGLYVPEVWPAISAAEISGFSGARYETVAADIIGRFVGSDIPAADLAQMCREAYAAFRHDAVAPLVQLGPGLWALELFHGPTLAFKDVAMQLLSRLMDYVLARRRSRVTIIGATSGDTGGAAIEAFRDRKNLDVFILFPKGRVSPVQQRQMTTSGAANVHAIAVDGDFDDCQALVKALFNDARLRRELSLAGVNSINWARIVAQVVYYFTAAVALGSPGRKVSFTVPTGNFGDIFAGYAAKRMGLPIERLVVATNVNDILSRTLASGRYERRTVTATASPSMDIQVSSNFERLLFEAYQRDASTVRALMGELTATGRFTIAAKPLATIRRDFAGESIDEAATTATIAATLKETGFLADPHTAVGIAAARRQPASRTPMVVLATAHPAKFPDAVEKACGIRPALPAGFDGILRRKEEFASLPNDRAAVAEFIQSRARAVHEKV
ncbi:MAG TPA: threonine synthase [Bauldia sp.]|nr:threonine synthase [Bauldia sp.]